MCLTLTLYFVCHARTLYAGACVRVYVCEISDVLLCDGFSSLTHRLPTTSVWNTIADTSGKLGTQLEQQRTVLSVETVELIHTDLSQM